MLVSVYVNGLFYKNYDTGNDTHWNVFEVIGEVHMDKIQGLMDRVYTESKSDLDIRVEPVKD